MAKKLRVK